MITPADVSLREGYLPLGLASHVKLKSDIEAGGQIRYQDVEIDERDLAVRIRREMEAEFAPRYTPLSTDLEAFNSEPLV